MPALEHQRLVKSLYRRLDDFVTERGLGEVFFAPLPVRLKPGLFREPDVVVCRSGTIAMSDMHPEGADLVIEVISPGEANRKRDLETKRREYATAGIAEYWIVDPERKRILVLRLRGKTYREHGEFGPGEIATSALLTGFEVDVKALFNVGKLVPGK